MSIEWGDHWGDPSHHDIVHISETGSHVADSHTEGVDDE